MAGQNYQEIYDNYVNTVPVDRQDARSGEGPLRPEIDLLNNINPGRVLDIGCGSGHRMFPYYKRINIDFLGVEKSVWVIRESDYKERILNLDITSPDFPGELEGQSNGFQPDLICLWGVVNGFLDETGRIRAWENIGKLASGGTQVLLSTLVNFDWYETAESGQVIQLPLIPPQYFYSGREIQRLCDNNSLEIVKQVNENYVQIVIGFFQLKDTGG